MSYLLILKPWFCFCNSPKFWDFLVNFAGVFPFFKLIFEKFSGGCSPEIPMPLPRATPAFYYLFRNWILSSIFLSFLISWESISESENSICFSRCFWRWIIYPKEIYYVVFFICSADLASKMPQFDDFGLQKSRLWICFLRKWLKFCVYYPNYSLLTLLLY